MSVKPIPDGYHAVTPYLVVADVAKQIDFLQKAFDAQVLYKMDTPQGPTHAELKIRDSILMIGQARAEHKPMPVMMYLYVEDADAAYKKAVKAGGQSVMEPTNQFYGDRSGAVKDANDNQWWVASRVEELTPDQVSERAQQAYASGAKK